MDPTLIYIVAIGLAIWVVMILMIPIRIGQIKNMHKEELEISRRQLEVLLAIQKKFEPEKE